MKRLLTLLPLCLLLGCDESKNYSALNKAELLTPVVVGTTEDGQIVKRYTISVEGNMGYPHHIYVLSSNNTVTVNSLQRKGKSHDMDVTVIVNGKSYPIKIQVEDEK